MKKDVLDAWKKERARVVRKNNVTIRKGQKKFCEHLKEHNHQVLTEVFANKTIEKTSKKKLFDIFILQNEPKKNKN